MLSGETKLNRGVRQGCPQSPFLFNLEILAILDRENELIGGLWIVEEQHKLGLCAEDMVFLCGKMLQDYGSISANVVNEKKNQCLLGCI